MARRGTATKEEQDEGKLLSSSGKKTSEKKGSNTSASSGWEAFQKKREESRTNSEFLNLKYDAWKPNEEETLVKFLDDEPFIVFFDVWVPAKNRGYSTLNAENPLTEELELPPRPQVLFNILLMEDEKWNLKALRATTMLAELVQKMANHKRHGPLTKHYWEMSATGTKKNYQPTMNVVKESDLESDWGVEALSDEDIEGFEEKKFTPDMVYLYDDDDLEEIVSELMES